MSVLHFLEDWMVLDMIPASIYRLYIYGVLEFAPEQINGMLMLM